MRSGGAACSGQRKESPETRELIIRGFFIYLNRYARDDRACLYIDTDFIDRTSTDSSGIMDLETYLTST